MKKRNLPIMFFGHHKGATETLRQMLIRASKDLGLKFAHYAADESWNIPGDRNERGLNGERGLSGETEFPAGCSSGKSG